MSDDLRFERRLADVLAAAAPTAAPEELAPRVLAIARRTRRRPRWLALAIERPMRRRAEVLVGAPTLRVAYLLVLALLVTLLAVATLVAGGLIPRPPDRAIVVTPPTSIQPSMPPTAAPPLGPIGVIAFSLSDDPGNSPGDVHLMNADGTADRVIGPGSCPALSKNGSVVAYRMGLRDTAEFMVAAPDGSSRRTLPGIGESEYALSPDGMHIAWFKALAMIETPLGGNTFERYQTELWVTPVSGGPGTRIAPASADLDETFRSLVWSPDGRQIAFAATETITNGGNAGSYRSAIYVVEADGSNLRQLTARPGTDVIGFSWSPDGHQIAYAGLPDGSPLPSLGPGSGPQEGFWPPLDVFVINADGTGDRNLTRTATHELNPDWSPDGLHLAYLTSEDAEVYRLATLRMGGLSRTEQPSLGPAPDYSVWSPTGAELLLVTISTQGDSGRLDHTAWSTFTRVDADLQQDPVTLLVSDGAIVCPPSWQSFEP